MKRRGFLAAGGALVGGGGALAARAQSAAKAARLGVLTFFGGEAKMWMPVLLSELGDLGFREGRNLSVEYGSADGSAANLEAVATKLLTKQPDVLVAGFGTMTAQMLKAQTSTIPIVFVTAGDPVGAGLVASLARPGANATGLTDQGAETGGKRLALLQEATSGKTSFAALGNPDTPYFKLAVAEIEKAAASRQVRVKIVEARSNEEIGKALDSLRGAGVAGVMVLADPVTIGGQALIIERATALKLPTMFQFREAVQGGGMMSYGANRKETYKAAADYVARILRGAKPGDLPVKQPTKFEFLVNYTTAKAIGLTLPPTFLATADDVIQ